MWFGLSRIDSQESEDKAYNWPGHADEEVEYLDTSYEICQ